MEVHWNFTHYFTLFALIIFTSLVLLEPQISKISPIDTPIPLKVIGAIEQKMCQSRCPFHPFICHIFGYLDSIIENYVLTFILLIIVAEVLRNFPQHNLFVWLFIHIASLFCFGVVLFSICGFLLINVVPTVCETTRRILLLHFDGTNAIFPRITWDDVTTFFTTVLFIDQETLQSIHITITNTITRIGLDHSITFIIFGLYLLFQRAFHFTTHVVFTIISLIFSSVIFSEIDGVFKAFCFALIAFFWHYVVYIFPSMCCVFIFPLFTYSAFSLAYRIMPVLQLFGASENFTNAATLIVFIWLMTWMYCWANSKTNLTAVVVIYFGIVMIVNDAQENLALLFMFSELFTHQTNTSI